MLPLAALFILVSRLRRLLYRWHWLPAVRLPVPVIVVGNITVGGSGKTPLVLWLLERLQQAGLRPGVVSRGHGGRFKGVAPVRPDSDPAFVGDEPVLIARRSTCPVWVGKRRAEAGQALLAYHPNVDVIVADDGLQHYALVRDVEIAVVDGVRGFGNGRLLPAGPLRESVRRLREVQALVVNGGDAGRFSLGVPAFAMRLGGRTFWNLRDPAKELDARAFQNGTVHAVAGIGHPPRFFEHLQGLGIRAEPHAFADHHPYRPEDLPTGTVLMTEKDAVKCAAWASEDVWALRIDALLAEGLQHLILEKLKACHGPQTA